MKIKAIRPVTPVPSRCIEVDSPQRLFAAGGTDGQSFVSHNSVVQRNILLGAILRPQHWRILCIDLKRVELSSYRQYSQSVLGVATTLEDALTVLRFAQQTMMKRYTEMEQIGVNNFLDLPEKGQALMVMVDELGELISTSGTKTEEGKAEDELKGEAQMIIGSIARLGRAAGVHLILATQRPDATLIAGETKANLGFRINCGRTDSTASSMILGNAEGTRVKSNPRGRLYLGIYSTGDHGQGFFATPEWIDEYLKSQGLNPDGTPLSSKRSRLANVVDIDKFANTDLDDVTGVDNAGAIDRIREEEEHDDDDETFTPVRSAVHDDDADDWGFEDDDDAEDEPEQPAGGLARPDLKGPETNLDKFTRPEDSWDSELERLIAENNK